MKSSRKVAALTVALALVGTGCSRFAPKAGVGVRGVSVDLAFGIDVEKLLSTPPPTTPTAPTLPPPTSPPPLPTPTFEPPPPVTCPVNATQSTRDGSAPGTVKEQEFQEAPDTNLEGSKPRLGKYLTFYQYNLSGESIQQDYDYKELRNAREPAVGGGFAYDVREPAFGHQIDTAWVVTPTPEDQGNENSADTSGIYLQELRIPLRDQPGGGEETAKRKFTVTDPGVRLVRFPLATGNESNDVVAVPSDPDTSGDVPTIGGVGNSMRLKSTVGAPELVFVCDQLAEAWRVGVTIEITGDTEVRIVGNFWIATQYGGWPIQESFTIDGGPDLMSGNFFTRIARLDPGDPV